LLLTTLQALEPCSFGLNRNTERPKRKSARKNLVDVDGDTIMRGGDKRLKKLKKADETARNVLIPKGKKEKVYKKRLEDVERLSRALAGPNSRGFKRKTDQFPSEPNGRDNKSRRIRTPPLEINDDIL
jgi:hypothetical protein